MKNRYFISRNGTYFQQFTKEEIYEKIDSTKPETFVPFLKMMDYPYIEYEWQRMLKRYLDRPIFGRYLALMRLRGFRDFSYADSNWLNEVRK